MVGVLWGSLKKWGARETLRKFDLHVSAWHLENLDLLCAKWERKIGRHQCGISQANLGLFLAVVFECHKTGALEKRCTIAGALVKGMLLDSTFLLLVEFSQPAWLLL